MDGRAQNHRPEGSRRGQGGGGRGRGPLPGDLPRLLPRRELDPLRVRARGRRRGVEGVREQDHTLHHAGIEDAELVVSSITDDVLRGTSNLRLLRSVRTHSPHVRVVLTTDHIPQALKFYDAGADFVFIPRLYSAAACARILRKGLKDGFQEVRTQAIGHLKQR
ncbi:MAG: hypothetical protein E6J30_00740, partial [Chloroflexi bacterium]